MSRGPAGAVMLALAIVACGSCLCPRVYHLAGPAATDPRPPLRESYGVLFVSSGFEKRDLPAYWRATQELANGVLRMLHEHPFTQGGDWARIDFYRIDVVGKHPQSDCAALRDCSRPLGIPAGAGPTPPGRLVDAEPIGPRYSDHDLGIRLCRQQFGRQNSDCASLSLSAVHQAEALALAGCAPSIDAVVVVVNYDDHAGETREDGLSSALGLALIGVSLESATDSERYLAEDAIDVLAHELGHMLGLFDEYVRSDPPLDESVFRQGRNVWKEPRELSCTNWQPLDIRSVPWRLLMGNDLDCAQDDSALTLRDETDSSKPGLWEGAFYRPHRYFRSKAGCAMSNEINQPFCPACVQHLEATLPLFSMPAEEFPDQQGQ